MAEYENGKDILLKRPEPGRPVYPAQKVVTKEVESKVDVNAIADAVVKALGGKIVMGQGSQTGQAGTIVEKKEDSFDVSESMSKLADAMVFNRDQNEANLEGLGKIKETKKDKKETDKTIDMLSKLGE